MTFDDLLNRGRTRTIFLVGFIIVVVSLLLVRYYALPQADDTLKQGWASAVAVILDNLVATGIATVIVGYSLWYLTPPRVRNAGIAVVEPRELKKHFDLALATTSSWKFAGGCGRYFRTAVIQNLEKRVRQESLSKSATAIILNPENQKLCAQHARYRSATASGHADGNWTTIRVQQELIATLVLAKRAYSSLFDVKVYVLDHFRGDRVDIADCYAIETREDHSAPALQSDSDSYFYQAVVNDFRLIEDQAKLIRGGESECRNVSDVSTLKTALHAMGLDEIHISDNDLKGVIKLIKERKNPYE